MTERAFFYVDCIPTKGCWVDLESIETMDEVIDALSDAGFSTDGDILVADIEGDLTKHFLEPCGVFNLEQYIEARDCGIDADVIAAYMDNGMPFDKAAIDEAYLGKFSSDKEFAQEFLEGTGMFDNVHREIAHYFNYEAYAKDLMVDHFENDGHYFRSL